MLFEEKPKLRLYDHPFRLFTNRKPVEPPPVENTPTPAQSSNPLR